MASYLVDMCRRAAEVISQNLRVSGPSIRKMTCDSMLALAYSKAPTVAEVFLDYFFLLQECEECEEARVHIDNLWKFVQRFHLQLLMYIYSLVLFSRISEFPGRIRPPCTTMPWTIWPALVVLWGVCWMFYPPTGSSVDEVEVEAPVFLDPLEQALDIECRYSSQSPQYSGILTLSGDPDIWWQQPAVIPLWDDFPDTLGMEGDSCPLAAEPSSETEPLILPLGSSALLPSLICQPNPFTFLPRHQAEADPSHPDTALSVVSIPDLIPQLQTREGENVDIDLGEGTDTAARVVARS